MENSNPNIINLCVNTITEGLTNQESSNALQGETETIMVNGTNR